MTLDFVDVTEGRSPESAKQLLQLQEQWFGDYAWARDELTANTTAPAHQGDRVVHQFLATINGVPAGFIVCHTNLARRVGLGHFMAVDPAFRGQGLAMQCERRAMQAAADDGRQYDVQMLAYVGEMEPAMVPVFERLGFVLLPIDYAEPFHGPRWAEHGEPTFFDRRLMAHRLPDGPELDLKAVALAGAAAFLIDHYQLPPDHPVVTRCVTPAAP
jgi:GNAT superfamily N-acetyltransferase